MGRPTVDTLRHCKLANLKELRIGTIRILFAFDPWRCAILLIAGNKAGSWSKWYTKAIPMAQERFDEYLRDRAEEEER